MDPVREAFMAECNELLTVLDESLLALEKDTANADLVNAIFRAVHTIKGGAGIIECRYIEGFVHVLENALDDVREGRLGVESALVDLMFSCVDQVRALLAFVADEHAEPPADLLQKSAALHDLLHKITGLETPPASVPELVAEPLQSAGRSMIGHDCWHISIRFGANVMREGMDPLSFIRYLASFGEITHVTTLTEAIPPADEMDPESCYLGFEIDFRADTSKERIERVFEFVRDNCLLHILPPDSKLADYIDLIMALPEDNLRLGEILVRAGVLTEQELRAGLAVQQQDITDEPAPPPLGEILVGQQVVQAELVEAAVSKQAQIVEKKALEAQLIRVHADKLDHLINLVGELVIAGSAVSMLAQRSHDSVMSEATSTISRLVEEVRDGALRLRMVQIGEVFTRFQRVVRDVSKEIGKDIELHIEGEDTELDKSVVDKIGDPLMHLVRNAMDHGIEGVQQRLARGKPARGQVALNAYHESGSVVIEVADDGGGLNRQKIRDKAIARGLLAANAEISDQELCRLIFEPGFSTADQVSSLSGRGVGMDVVRRNIEALRGTVDVESREGEGSLIRIRLPLTLAIIDGFLMGVGGSAFVVPLEMVEECIEQSQGVGGRNYINLRGEVLPCIRLREFLEIGGPAGKRENVVVVRYGGRKAGLVVDELMGEFQTVIKPLGRIFQRLRGVAGSTILGGGEVALILDVPALIGLAVEQEKTTRAVGVAGY